MIDSSKFSMILKARVPMMSTRIIYIFWLCEKRMEIDEYICVSYVWVYNTLSCALKSICFPSSILNPEVTYGWITRQPSHNYAREPLIQIFPVFIQHFSLRCWLWNRHKFKFLKLADLTAVRIGSFIYTTFKNSLLHSPFDTTRCIHEKKTDSNE